MGFSLSSPFSSLYPQVRGLHLQPLRGRAQLHPVGYGVLLTGQRRAVRLQGHLCLEIAVIQPDGALLFKNRKIIISRVIKPPAEHR